MDDAAPRRPFVAIGEVLWDLLPSGPRLGGAPLNVVANAARLGHPGVVVSAVGDDALGDRARAELLRTGLDLRWLQRSREHPTGVAEVRLDAEGSPAFRIVRPAAYDDLTPDPAGLDALAALRPVALVYGTLAQSSPGPRAVVAHLAAACPDAWRLYDLNLRPDAWSADTVRVAVRHASVVKLSADEAPELAAVLGVEERDPVRLLEAIGGRTGARAVCLTRGAQGALLRVGDIIVEGSPPPIDVIDAVGAGDAFAAALLDGLVRGRAPDAILRRALALGALVASRDGATPVWTRDDLEGLEAATPASAVRERGRG